MRGADGRIPVASRRPCTCFATACINAQTAQVAYVSQAGQAVPSFATLLAVPALHWEQPAVWDVAPWTKPYQPLCGCR